MGAAVFSWTAVGIIIFGAAALMALRDWRWMLGILAILYLAVFILVFQHWPLGMSVVKLVTGWMATATLGMTRLGLPAPDEERGPLLLEGSAFRLFGAAIAALVAVSAANRVNDLIPGIGLPVIIGGLTLIGMGLFQLGMTFDALRVAIGLLTILGGFETLYAAVESSILVAALLSAANLGLALAGSYLLLNSHPVDEEAEELV
jgi:hypothetical protein